MDIPLYSATCGLRSHTSRVLNGCAHIMIEKTIVIISIIMIHIIRLYIIYNLTNYISFTEIYNSISYTMYIIHWKLYSIFYIVCCILHLTYLLYIIYYMCVQYSNTVYQYMQSNQPTNHFLSTQPRCFQYRSRSTWHWHCGLLTGNRDFL